MKISRAFVLGSIGLLCHTAQAAPEPSPSASAPYTIVKSAQLMGSGGIDYVFADSAERKLYVPRGSDVLVFDIDSLAPAGTIPNVRARGVAVDPKSNHGFASSSPVAMWDAKSLAVLKTIPVEGRPDGILFEPVTERIYVFSHQPPNATIIDGKDGAVVGTLDLGGAPEQAASDGQGHLYVTIEDKNKIAVVDVQTLKVTAQYDLAGQGRGPAGLGLDVKNRILFAFCHEPSVCVILGADDGKILATLAIGKGVDGGGFNPKTMEAFSSQGDGTLTIIKENSPTEFAVEQTVTTKPRAKTCTLDTARDQIILITTEPSPAGPAGAPPAEGSSKPSTPASAPAAAPAAAPGPGGNAPREGGDRRGGGGGGRNGPGMLDILVVGK